MITKLITDSCVAFLGGCQSEKSPYSARYEDGKLYYEGEWYENYLIVLCFVSFILSLTVIRVEYKCTTWKEHDE